MVAGRAKKQGGMGGRLEVQHASMSVRSDPPRCPEVGAELLRLAAAKQSAGFVDRGGYSTEGKGVTGAFCPPTRVSPALSQYEFK